MCIDISLTDLCLKAHTFFIHSFTLMSSLWYCGVWVCFCVRVPVARQIGLVLTHWVSVQEPQEFLVLHRMHTFNCGVWEGNRCCWLLAPWLRVIFAKERMNYQI